MNVGGTTNDTNNDNNNDSSAKQIGILQAGDCFGAVSLETELLMAQQSGRQSKGLSASLIAKSKCEIFTLSSPYYKVTLHKEIR